MRWRALALVALSSTALAAPPAKPPPPPPPPVGPLPMVPSIARVRLVVSRTQLVVVEEVTLPRGDWRGEPFDLYVAFGAPGAPRAIDAHLVAVADGALEPADDDAGQALATERATRRPPSAHALLGRDAMAGVVVHVTRDAMARALEPGGMAALRMRTALDLPEEDPAGGRSVVVRLGASQGAPLTVGRIRVDGNVQHAEAKLCGPEADEHPLIVHGRTIPRMPPDKGAIAPVIAPRHATDDLCARVWP